MAIRTFIRKHPILNVNIIKILYHYRKGKIRQVIHYIAAGHWIKSKRVAKFLQQHGPKLLQVGGGKHLKVGKSWFNGDIIAGDVYLNAAKHMPFPDNSFDIIFSEQFIEHLTQNQAVLFMREAYRILKPGGIIRLATPDLEKLISVYQNKNLEVDRTTAISRHLRNHRSNAPFVWQNECQYLNDFFRIWGHQFLYDHKTIQMLTEGVGFCNICWCKFGESDFEYLKHLERHADVEWMENGTTMIFEAEKPTTEV